MLPSVTSLADEIWNLHLCAVRCGPQPRSPDMSNITKPFKTMRRRGGGLTTVLMNNDLQSKVTTALVKQAG